MQKEFVVLQKFKRLSLRHSYFSNHIEETASAQAKLAVGSRTKTEWINDDHIFNKNKSFNINNHINKYDDVINTHYVLRVHLLAITAALQKANLSHHKSVDGRVHEFEGTNP